jgi:hypothetical protein
MRKRAPCRRDEVALHLRHAEHGGLRRDDEVAREHELGPARERRAVDGRDDRLRTLAHHEPPEAATRRHHAAGVDAHLLQIRAGAEDVALRRLRARQDADPHLVVGLQAVDRLLDAGRDRGVDRVPRVRPVDGDDGDVALLLVVDHPRVATTSPRP